MKPVVAVSELLDKLEENRRKHRTVFEAAVEGWYSRCLDELDAARKRVLKNAPQDMNLRLAAPKDHTGDYDRAIVMVHMHTEPTIELSETDAAHFIMDDWEWKRSWLGANSIYAAGTVSEVYGDDIEF